MKTLNYIIHEPFASLFSRFPSPILFLKELLFINFRQTNNSFFLASFWNQTPSCYHDWDDCFCISCLSWQKFLSYRNQSIDLQNKSINWSLYDGSLHHERVKQKQSFQNFGKIPRLGRFSANLHTCHTLKYVSDNFAKCS